MSIILKCQTWMMTQNIIQMFLQIWRSLKEKEEKGMGYMETKPVLTGAATRVQLTV